MSDEKIYGLLTATTVELPFENAEAQAEADKTNAQLGGLFRVFRGGTDWGFQAKGEKEPALLQSGDLVRIFKTVTDGDVCWQGTVDFDTKHYHHVLQKSALGRIIDQPTLLGSFHQALKSSIPLSVLPVIASLRHEKTQPDAETRKWIGMFYKALPAKLERDGKVIYGALDAFSETGTEGVIWSLSEYGKTGYDGLNCLKNGDKLTVYDTVRDGAVEWEGRVDFSAPNVTKIGWTEVMRTSAHMDTENWLQLSWQRRPAVLTPAPK
jgi:hypothetical protein